MLKLYLKVLVYQKLIIDLTAFTNKKIPCCKSLTEPCKSLTEPCKSLTEPCKSLTTNFYRPRLPIPTELFLRL